MLWQSAMQTELMLENQKQAMGGAARMRAILKQHMITQMNAKIQQAQILQRVEYMSNCNVNLSGTVLSDFRERSSAPLSIVHSDMLCTNGQGN